MARRNDAKTLRIALAQIDTTVGDVEGNARKAAEWIERARSRGRPPRRASRADAHRLPARGPLAQAPLPRGRPARALRELAAEVTDIVALVGFADANGVIHNSLAVLGDGEIAGIYRKMLLPNYGVFDERRYFEPGSTPALIEIGGRPDRADDLRGHLVPGPAARAPRRSPGRA